MQNKDIILDLLPRDRERALSVSDLAALLPDMQRKTISYTVAVLKRYKAVDFEERIKPHKTHSGATYVRYYWRID